METIQWADFEKVEIRVGTILEVQPFPEARNPSYKLKVDFGEFGLRQTSAQITTRYTESELVGKQILGVVNFPAKQIANYISEFLLTGVKDANGGIVLATVEAEVPNGGRLI